ncbi:MAG: YqjK-like family protein [Candidatus Accumulibacter sp.]|jgi:hypothetical protein|nr:YqjK-like family protein [Accumulibacter sp.]
MATLSEIHIRRGRLLERIAAQRARLRDGARPIRRVLDKADSAIAGVHAGVACIKQRPWVLGLFAATMFALKGRRFFRVLKRGFLVWKAWVSLRDNLRDGRYFGLDKLIFWLQ